jgi:triacylglycerol esterase/lipase EstA (alpha/beta hydrolase family)
MPSKHIYLVPGFFGFTSIGSLNYFNGVATTLDRFLRQRGDDWRIIECETQPTGSIRNRADRLLSTVIEHGGLEADELHFVGHSTGGLDIRLLVTPGVRLRPGDVEDELGRRTRNIITVSTPHFGTPLANFFTSLQGRNLLQLLAVLATSDQGRYSIFVAAQATSILARIDDRLGRRETFLDYVASRLLEQVTPRTDDPFWDFLRDISADQGAIIQLTPEGMNLYNAAVTDRDGVRYSAVVSAAPSPRLRLLPEMGSVERATRYALFSVLHTLTGREHRHYPYPSPPPSAATDLSRDLPFSISASTSDGVVPTLSQVYGEVVQTVVADHLDVVGQFRNAGGQRYADWLPSGSRFDQGTFDRIWQKVAEVLSG